MELLQAGVDCSVIALWLGHESVETTQSYLHAHLALKEAALAKLKPYERGKRPRFRPNPTSPTEGVGNAKVLKSLGHSPKGRHYRG
jgi:integrase